MALKMMQRPFLISIDNSEDIMRETSTISTHTHNEHDNWSIIGAAMGNESLEMHHFQAVKSNDMTIINNFIKKVISKKVTTV